MQLVRKLEDSQNDLVWVTARDGEPLQMVDFDRAPSKSPTNLP